jgi:hypothetical protein
MVEVKRPVNKLEQRNGVSMLEEMKMQGALAALLLSACMFGQ